MIKGVHILGRACAGNPIPIIIPCHRVVCQDGSLGGFRCGIGIKKKLLAIEGINLCAREKQIRRG